MSIATVTATLVFVLVYRRAWRLLVTMVFSDEQ